MPSLPDIAAAEVRSRTQTHSGPARRPAQAVWSCRHVFEAGEYVDPALNARDSVRQVGGDYGFATTATVAMPGVALMGQM